jgi:type I restriction-modification system DNA methylase subunit
MAVVNWFQGVTRIIRDGLRKDGVVGIESMRHICIYVLARFMTIDRAKSVNFPSEFAWENMMRTLSEDAGVQIAYDMFCNTNRSDYFLKHLDGLFGTNDFTFRITDITVHKEIMEHMNNVDLTVIDKEIDILGYIYEEHMRTGSVPPRDLGQFFTDRAICKYMISLGNPHIHADGSLDTVCDPSMGTGGFLTTAIKHYNALRTTSAQSPIDWHTCVTSIHGCDIDGCVAAIARMNVFMETGCICAPNLMTRNSLFSGLPARRYNVILANVPFGITKIDYEKCTDTIRGTNIKSSASEPLFLQLIANSLARCGRAVVIVPSGFTSSMKIPIIKMRQYIVENFDLHQVIDMGNNDFFMNTSVNTHILFFSQGVSTSVTHIKRLTRNQHDGSIIDEEIGQIDYNDMKRKKYSWFLNRYTKQVISLPPNSHTRICKLSNICMIHFGNQIDTKSYIGKGLAVIMHKNIDNGCLVISDEQEYVANDAPREHLRPVPGDIVISTVFDCGRLARVDAPGWILNNHICLVRVANPDILPEYLFYVLYYGGFYERMHSLQSGSTIQGILREDIETYCIVMYSIDEQRQKIAYMNEILSRKSTICEQIKQYQQTLRECDDSAKRIFMQ